MINHKFSCNQCGQCSFTIDNPAIYRDLSYNNLIIILRKLVPHNHIFKISLEDSKIKCDGTITIIQSSDGPSQSLSHNKSIIKEVLEKWYNSNGTLYSYPGSQQEKIIGMIYIMDLIHNHSTFMHLLLSLSLNSNTELI